MSDIPNGPDKGPITDNANSPWGSGGSNGNGNKPGGGKNPWGQGRPPNKPNRPQGGQQNPDIDNVIRGLKDKFGGPKGGGGNGKGGRPQGVPNLPLPWIILGAGFLYLLASSIYTVQGNERAAVLRFGDYVRTTGPGLHFKMPTPIETKRIVNVTSQRETRVGVRSQSESLMLTGDENIVDVNFTVLWVIDELGDYLFKVDKPDDLVKSAAESVVREIVGKNNLDSIITTGRQELRGAVATQLQELLNEYEAGVKINDVQFQKTDPPPEVEDDFLDVVNAGQEAERDINEANAYRNKQVLEAEGTAARLLQEAEGYKQSVIADAEGEAARFRLVYQEYKLAPQVTRQRMYLETIEDVYAPADKIILDSGAGSGVVPYLPLDKLTRQTGGQ